MGGKRVVHGAKILRDKWERPALKSCSDHLFLVSPSLFAKNIGCLFSALGQSKNRSAAGFYNMKLVLSCY